MIHALINKLPLSIKGRVLASLLWNTNNRILTYARMELSARRNIAPTSFDENGQPIYSVAKNAGRVNYPGQNTIDDANDLANTERALAESRDNDDTTRQAQDNGTGPADVEAFNPAKMAEPFVSLKEILVDLVDQHSREVQRPAQDPSLANFIHGQLNMPFRPREDQVKARVIMSNGRITAEMVRNAQRNEWQDNQDRLKRDRVELLVLAEKFYALDDEYTLDELFNQLDPLVQLSLLNTLHAKLSSFFGEGKGSFATMRGNNIANDMNKTAASIDDVMKTVGDIYEANVQAYINHVAMDRARIPAVELHISTKAQARSAGATAMAGPTTVDISGPIPRGDGRSPLRRPKPDATPHAQVEDVVSALEGKTLHVPNRAEPSNTAIAEALAKAGL